MKCSECNLYSKGLKRCTLGKVNPASYAKTKEIAQLMGYSYICNKCQFKEKLLNTNSLN